MGKYCEHATDNVSTLWNGEEDEKDEKEGKEKDEGEEINWVFCFKFIGFNAFMGWNIEKSLPEERLCVHINL